MSLLLKALSRVENREQTPPVEAQVPSPESSIAVEEPISGAESNFASTPATEISPLEPPLWTLPEETEFFAEEVAPEAAVNEYAAQNQSVLDEQCALDQPALDEPVAEQPATLSQPIAQPVVEPAASDQPVVDPATVEQPLADATAIEQPVADSAVVKQPEIEEQFITELAHEIEPLDQTLDTLPPIEESFTTAADFKIAFDAEPLPNAEPSPVPVAPLSNTVSLTESSPDAATFPDAAPSPEAEAPSTEDSPQPDFESDGSFEPLWDQLEKLQNLVSSDVEYLDFESLKFANADDFPVDVTETETVEIEAIEPPPTIIPLREPDPVPVQPLTPIQMQATIVSAPPPTPEPIQTNILRAESVFSIAPKIADIQPAAAAVHLNIKPEYRELRDQLLARLNIAKHPTVLLIDAGRTVGDVSWLLPLASGILEKLNATSNTLPQILLVEAAGTECGLARTLGLDTHLGLSHVLNGQADWRTTIQPTQHPQIKLLGRGAQQLRCDNPKRLAKLWTELTPQFDLIFVAAGPRNQTQPGNRNPRQGNHSATAVFPHASAAILCVELNATSQAEASETKRLLDSRGIKVLGCIVQPT